MDKKIMRKRLRRAIMWCSSVGIAVIIAAAVILRLIYFSMFDMVDNQMHAETIDYSDRITRQIDKDLQALDTIAVFLWSSGLREPNDIAEVLQEANYKNDFITLGYFDKDGRGALAHLERGVKKGAAYEDLNPTAAESIRETYETGEPTVSRLFVSTVDEHLLYTYNIPIVENGEVQAVLSASDYIDVFDELLNKGVIMDGNGSIHLISGNGYTVLSSNTLPAYTKILDEKYFSAEDIEKMNKVLSGEEHNAYVTFNDGNKWSRACLEPVGVNNWYLLCVHNGEDANRTASSAFTTIVIAAGVLLALIILLLIIIYHIIITSNKHLNELAYHDRLTGADNMTRFFEKLREAREHPDTFCIVALNIRQFKFVNEIFGTDSANELLNIICGIAGAGLRNGEFFARETADLFYMYLKEKDEEAVRARIEGLISAICEYENSDRPSYSIQMYSGAYIHDDCKEPNTNREVILGRATFAMKYCKEQPGMLLHFYDEQTHRSEELVNYVNSHMQQALEDREFKVYLQPKMDLNTGKIGGAEALVRWITADGDMIYPSVFIPQFERNGFCVEMDMYIMEEVLKLQRHWIDIGLEPVPVSVNQSKLLFFRKSYISDLKALTEKYNIPTELITLEILETLALDRPEKMNKKLHTLREMGFRISMDDFGCGYSSFNTLGNLEIDELKLDRSFLLEAAGEKGCRFKQIMAGIIELTKVLGISTVAEGVETEEDEHLIRSLGCDMGQGYLYSRPIPAQEFTEKYVEPTEK